MTEQDTSNRNAHPDNLSTVLDSLDALVYVADMQTREVLYMNSYGVQVWGDAVGKPCWRFMQAGQSGPCEFCTNPRLVDENGQPTGPYVWEFQNTVDGRWYQCRDQAIRWHDGRLVRLEIATDITDRKAMEEALRVASRTARALAHTDDLTGLNNRRAFFSHGQQALKRCSRLSQAASLIVFDVDHFKRINDSYGHLAGDRVLVDIAGAVQPLVRANETLGRIGGEEFAVLLEGASQAEALGVAERLRTAIAELTIKLPDADIHCTASFGIATSPDGQDTLERLLSAADQAMYVAKAAGRNRVSLKGSD